MNMLWDFCKTETSRKTRHKVIILRLSIDILVEFKFTKISVSKKDDHRQPVGRTAF